MSGDEWKQSRDDSTGDTYFLNRRTGETRQSVPQPVHPAIALLRQMPAAEASGQQGTGAVTSDLVSVTPYSPRRPAEQSFNRMTTLRDVLFGADTQPMRDMVVLSDSDDDDDVDTIADGASTLTLGAQPGVPGTVSQSRVTMTTSITNTSVMMPHSDSSISKSHEAKRMARHGGVVDTTPPSRPHVRALHETSPEHSPAVFSPDTGNSSPAASGASFSPAVWQSPLASPAMSPLNRNLSRFRAGAPLSSNALGASGSDMASPHSQFMASGLLSAGARSPIPAEDQSSASSHLGAGRMTAVHTPTHSPAASEAFSASGPSTPRLPLFITPSASAGMGVVSGTQTEPASPRTPGYTHQRSEAHLDLSPRRRVVQAERLKVLSRRRVCRCGY